MLFKVQPYHCLILVRCPPNFYGGTMWCWCNSMASLNSWWSGLGASAGAAAGALQGANRPGKNVIVPASPCWEDYVNPSQRPTLQSFFIKRSLSKRSSDVFDDPSPLSTTSTFEDPISSASSSASSSAGDPISSLMIDADWNTLVSTINMLDDDDLLVSYISDRVKYRYARSVAELHPSCRLLVEALGAELTSRRAWVTEKGRDEYMSTRTYTAVKGTSYRTAVKDTDTSVVFSGPKQDDTPHTITFVAHDCDKYLTELDKLVDMVEALPDAVYYIGKSDNIGLERPVRDHFGCSSRSLLGILMKYSLVRSHMPP